MLALLYGGILAPCASALDNKLVTFELKITDDDSGLTVSLKRQLPSGTNAYSALQASVPVQVKEYAGLGVRVLKICDVAPVRGKHWGLYVDGKKSETGIAGITIDKDILIEWKTQP